MPSQSGGGQQKYELWRRAKAVMEQQKYELWRRAKAVMGQQKYKLRRRAKAGMGHHRSNPASERSGM